ncbi:MAG TPA: DNA polymerase domain-containing protein [Candidatus Udaeobacter sp.]|jgi:DNA polymerase elongation subunit (family B)|nr:DNA polymerase domain-containing protein [Candidatus Udaeobacter sp.]
MLVEFEKNRLLFGADQTPRIVAVELGESGTVRVHRRETDGSTVTDVEPFHPFVWADSDVVDLGIESEKLDGDLKYGWLVTVDSWKELIALRSGLKNAGRDFFAFTDPVQHYFTATGRTLFKELEFEALRRMQVEVLWSQDPVAAGDDPQACGYKSADRIISIALSDNSGWEELIIIDRNHCEESEHAALKRLTALIKERDPDVIEGHDLFRVHLPLLVARAKKVKTKLDWGRSGGFLRSRPSRLQIAEKTIDYPKFTIDGRHFVDTFLLAQFYDVGMRSLAGFERPDVARHFDLCDSDQISGLTGKELQRAYLSDSEIFRQRALCGVRETRALSNLLSASYFIQAQIFPYNYQDVIVRGNATRINALFLREYLQQRHSIPELPVPRAFEGGYTDIFFTGVARNVWHCDVASLYPSIMLRFDCFPATDALQIFRHLLTDLRTFRLEAKAKMRAEQDPARLHHLQALQNTFKILLNSFYGYLGFAQGHFADFDAAARVTQIGRDLLGKMIEWLKANGAQVIEVDTDGIYFVPAGPGAAAMPPRNADSHAADAALTTANEIDHLQKGLAKELPSGIDVEIDEQFDAMLSYKAKNYALLTKDGDVIIKGGALKSRGLEKFQRVFLEQIIKLIMQEKHGLIANLRSEFERKIRNREWNIDMLMKTDTLQDSLDKYRAKIAGSTRNRAAAYELALASGRNYRPGDQISYYIKATPKKVPAYEAAKPANEFDPENRDENVDYYLAKLDDLMKKFSGLIPTASTPKQENLALT